MNIFVENNHSNVGDKDYDTLLVSRNEFVLLLQSRYINVLLQNKLSLIIRRIWRQNTTLFIIEGKKSKFYAFVVYILVVYVNINLNIKEKKCILSKTTYTLNR